MESINNYKLKEFLKLDFDTALEYINVLQYLEPKETLQEVFYMKLKEVDLMKRLVTSNETEDIIELIKMVQDLDEKEIYELPIVDFFGIYNSIKQQLITINKAEENSLTSDNVNVKWLAVDGSKRLERFGIYNVLDNLSDGDILKWDAINNLPYSEVFTKLLLNKVKDDLQSEMNGMKKEIL